MTVVHDRETAEATVGTPAGGGAHPLMAAQEGLAGLEILHPGTSAGTTAEMLVCPGRLDPDEVRRALEHVHRRHEQLRVRLCVTDGDPRQEVLPHTGTHLEVREVDGPVGERAAVTAALDAPLDVRAGETTRAVLVQTPDGSRLVHCAHHLVVDGFGAGLLLREFARHHTGSREGSAAMATLPPAPTLEELTTEDLARRASPEYRAAREDWAAWRGELPPVPGVGDRAASGGAVPGRAVREVPAGVRTGLGTLRRELGVGWQNLLVTLLGGLANVGAETDAVAVGVPVANRTGPHRVAGSSAPRTAVTVLPVLVPESAVPLLDASAEVARWEHRIATAPGVTQEYLLALDRAEGTSRVPTAQVNVMPFAQRVVLGGVPAGVRNLRVGPVPGWTLTLRGDWGEDGDVRIEVDVNPLSHPGLDPGSLADRALRRLAAAVHHGPTLLMSDLPRLTDTEEALATDLHARDPYPVRARTLYESFDAGVRQHPGRDALVGENKVLSTDRLWAESLAVARALAARGVSRGDVVGLCLPRSIDQVVAVHALLHLGAVYLPLHVGLPRERRAGMCADAGARLVVDAEVYAQLRAETGHPDWRPTPAGIDDPAYLVFTSGSTGRPKGVVITHRAIDNRLRWMQDQCRLQPGETVLYKTPCSFDVHVWELYWPHHVGGRVRVAPEGAEREPAELAGLLTGAQGGAPVDVVHFVPSMLRALLAAPGARRRLAAGPAPREIVCSGEALGRTLAEDTHAVTGTWPLNLYGPTEAAVDVTFHRCSADEPGPDVPLGRPIWNCRCLVLDDAGRPVPPGHRGTLWLGGVQLSTGYLGREDLNRKAFRHSARHGRIYDTGDLVSRDADGVLHYHGRRDGQVKIRGQRVELAEIESVLRGVDGVRDAVCLVHRPAGEVPGEVPGEGGGADLLVAHLEVTPGGPAPDPATVRDTVSRRLAAVMVPARWWVHDTLPTTANGKVDRAALADLGAGGTAGAGLSGRSADGGVVATAARPNDTDEVLLATVRAAFAEVLGQPVGPDDGFFTLGGDSLGAVRLVGSLERRVGRAPSVREVLSAPSPRALTAVLAGDFSAAGDGSLVELSPGIPGSEDGTPTVLLPPAGGLCWSYLPMVTALSGDGPVWAVQSPLLSDRDWDASDLEELCAWQAGVVRTRGGTRPVRLTGWSVGGTCAQAIAAAGMLEVTSLLLLDAYPSEQWAALPLPGPVDRLAALARMGGVDESSLEQPITDRSSLARALARAGSALAALGEDTVQTCLAGVDLSARLLRSHVTRPWDGPAVHLAASASLSEGFDPAGWMSALPALGRERIDGDHLAVLAPELVSGALRGLGR